MWQWRKPLACGLPSFSSHAGSVSLCKGPSPGVCGFLTPNSIHNPSYFTFSHPSAMYVRVQISSVAQSCPTLCDPMDCSMPGCPVHHQLPELAQTHVLWVGDAIQRSHPLLSPSPPIFNLSQHQGLSNESVLHIRWPKYGSFSISPSNENSGLISFRIEWFDLLSVQGTLKSFIQHHSSKASIIQCSALFVVHSHIHTWLLEKS